MIWSKDKLESPIYTFFFGFFTLINHLKRCKHKNWIATKYLIERERGGAVRYDLGPRYNSLRGARRRQASMQEGHRYLIAFRRTLDTSPAKDTTATWRVEEPLMRLWGYNATLPRLTATQGLRSLYLQTVSDCHRQTHVASLFKRCSFVHLVKLVSGNGSSTYTRNEVKRKEMFKLIYGTWWS